MDLWPVEHFCPHFFPDSTDLEKKWGQKGSTGQRFICSELTSYKIHILEQFFLTVGQNHFGNKILFLHTYDLAISYHIVVTFL